MVGTPGKQPPQLNRNSQRSTLLARLSQLRKLILSIGIRIKCTFRRSPAVLPTKPRQGHSYVGRGDAPMVKEQQRRPKYPSPSSNNCARLNDPWVRLCAMEREKGCRRRRTTPGLAQPRRVGSHLCCCISSPPRGISRSPRAPESGRID